MTFKEKLAQVYFSLAVIILGLPILGYGAWFQSVGFTYASLLVTILTFCLGIYLGIRYILRFEKKLVHPSITPKLRRKSEQSLCSGNIFGFFAGAALLYSATYAIVFYIAMTITSMFWASVTFFVIYRKIKASKEEKNQK